MNRIVSQKRKFLSTIKPKLLSFAGVIVFALFLWPVSSIQAFQGYNVVITTNPATEQGFLSSTTNQWMGTVVSNPLAPPTLPVYQINLTGINPAFNPSVTNLQLLNSIVQISTYNYVYGFGGGMIYQNKVDSDITTNYALTCSTPSAFNLTQTSTSTFDMATCEDVLDSVLNALFQVNLSTPPVLPFMP